MVDFIPYDISYFISYIKTLMWEELIKSIKVWFSEIWNIFSNFKYYFFEHTILWNILWFIWDLIVFLLYAVRSILLLLWNIIYNIFNWFFDFFTQLNSTFEDLSLYMWSTTTIMFSFFLLILLIIVFWFLFRFFTWKYHYNKISWKK